MKKRGRSGRRALRAEGGPSPAPWPSNGHERRQARHGSHDSSGGPLPAVGCSNPAHGHPRAPQRGSTHPCEAVPRPRWEVAADFGHPWLQRGCDEQPPAPEELAVHSPRVGVLGEPGRGGEGQRGARETQHPPPAEPSRHRHPSAPLTRGRGAAPPSRRRSEPGGRGCRGRAGGSSGGGGRSSWRPGRPG